ncbi:MAG: HAMP domain-containing protein [Deltaproteobacteria bacterium]|nr:HAMP domain-containing protein [Deltaproteobacteria bacterium]
MRTLSARILLGFAALTVTFGVITASVVYQMTKVEEQVIVIGKGYVPLALGTKDLARRQEDLRNYLEERLTDESNAQVARMALTRSRNIRDRTLKSTLKTLETVEQLVHVDPRQFAVTRPTLVALEQAVAGVAPLYDDLLTAPPLGPEDVWDGKQKLAFEALGKLRNEERKLSLKANALSEQLDGYVATTTFRLEQNEQTLRLRTIYLGLAAVLLGLVITVWVVITLRPLRRLRDGARRIAAGDYASRIPERGPSEVADLAREFNSMGRAVEERERELVRSERLAAVGKMAAMITHEVRNPLSSIGLNTELIEEELLEVPNAEEARGLCRSIHREVDRLTAITEEYLAFARLPKPKVAHEPVNPMVAALASFVREDLAGKKVALSTELSSDDPIGLIDAGQIRQCLINLVRNASEAVAAKGGGRVTLRTRRDGDRVAIEVEDDGVGIPADVLPRLFDPFFSTKDSGSGLGLALTQQIVRDHGGDLDVSSVVGRGTTFTVRVPGARA